MDVAEFSRWQGRIPRAVLHELTRPSLLQILSGQDSPLVVLVAPAGYGKTTLLAQYARHHEGRVVWLNLVEDDADPWVLARRLVQAIQATLPTLLLPHWQHLGDDTPSSESLAYALAADLTASTTNLDFILDGTELLGESSERWLSRWLSSLAEGHRLLLAGRSEPRLDLARRVASGDAWLLGPQDLAFSESETRDCLAPGEVPLSASAVHAQLEGWPVGVALVRSGAGPHLTAADLIRGVLDQLPSALRGRLPEISVMDVWTEEGPEAHGLGGFPFGWLQDVRRAGLPLIPLGNSYRPHQLLREVLSTELRARPERHRALHLQVAVAAEEAGHCLEAVHAYLTAGAPERALELASGLASTYDLRGEYLLVRRTLDLFPEGTLSPELKRLLGHALFETGDAVRGGWLLNELKDRGETTPALWFSLGLLAARSGQWTLEFDHAETGLLASPTPRERGRLLRLRSSALLMLGRVDASYAAAQDAVSLAERQQDPLELGSAMISLVHVYQRQDQQDLLQATLRRAVDLFSGLNMPSRTVWLQNDLASLLRRQGRTGEALDLVHAALQVAEAEQTVDQALLEETWGDLQFWPGEYPGAALHYYRAFQHSRTFGTDLLGARISVTLTEAALLAGEPVMARETLHWIQQMAEGNGELYRAAREFCQGLWAVQDQHWDVAETHFMDADRFSAGMPGIVSRERAQMYQALCAVRLRTFTVDMARRLETDWTETASHHFLKDDRPRLQSIASESDRVGRPPVTLLRLISELAPENPPEPDGQLLTLQVRSLGAVRVSVNGDPLHLPLTRSAEVLVWLAIHGESTRDQLVDALWDGSNERRHVEYFKVAVRHLRATLATHPAVTFNPLPFLEGRYRLSERFTVDVDVLRARHALISRRPETLQRTLDEYVGTFLPQTEASWAEPFRTEALETAISAALTLGEALEADDPVAAALAYQRAADLDPLAEEPYVKLLRLYLARHDRTAAEHCYRRYRRMLSEEWGRNPGEEWTTTFGHQ
jgi:LuxR family maltose regulon positive regulatory protein